MEKLIGIAQRSLVVTGDVMSVKSTLIKMNHKVPIERALILPDRQLCVVTLPNQNLLHHAIFPESQRLTWQKWYKRRGFNLPPFQFVKGTRFPSQHLVNEERHFIEVEREPMRKGPIEIFKRLYYSPNVDDQLFVAYDSLRCRDVDLLIHISSFMEL